MSGTVLSMNLHSSHTVCGLSGLIIVAVPFKTLKNQSVEFLANILHNINDAAHFSLVAVFQSMNYIKAYNSKTFLLFFTLII